METLLLLAAVAALVSFAWAARSAAPWVPTRKADVDDVLDFAGVRPGETFCELGCGDGRMLRAAAARGARAEGFEISLAPYLAAQVGKWMSKDRARIRVRFASLWKADVSRADVVYMFLMPETCAKIAPKLRGEMKKGARVVAYAFPVDGWTPAAERAVEGRAPLYLHVV